MLRIYIPVSYQASHVGVSFAEHHIPYSTVHIAQYLHTNWNSVGAKKEVGVGSGSSRAFRRRTSRSATSPSWLSSNRAWKNRPGGAIDTYTVVYGSSADACMLPLKRAGTQDRGTVAALFFHRPFFSTEELTTQSSFAVETCFCYRPKPRDWSSVLSVHVFLTLRQLFG